jgi:hypothetical protein
MTPRPTNATVAVAVAVAVDMALSLAATVLVRRPHRTAAEIIARASCGRETGPSLEPRTS